MHLSRADFVLLHRAVRNPHAAEIERAAAAVAEEAGLLPPEARRRFAAFNTLVPYVYPTATIERAVTTSIWCNWLFFFDDIHDEAEGRDAGEGALAATIATTLAVLRGERPPAGDALAAYAARFRREAVAAQGAAWMDRFCRGAEDYLLRGSLPAYRHFLAGSIPDVEAYLAQRDHDSAVMTALDLVELAAGITLPERVLADPDLRAAQQATIRTVACFNDIVSYPKEVLVQHNPNNLVHVLQEKRGLALEAAMGEAVRITNTMALRLARAASALEERHGATVPEVGVYTEGLRCWQRGNIESSLREARYRSPLSPFLELRDPPREAGRHVGA